MASPYRDWFHLHEDVRQGRRALTAFPSVEQLADMEVLRRTGVLRGSASPSVLGYQAWWDLPALPKLDLDEPHLRGMILDGGRALAALRHRWLAARRRRGGRGRLLARVPHALPGREAGRLSRGRGLVSAAGVAGGRHVRRLHELPPGHRHPGLRRSGAAADVGRAAGGVRGPARGAGRCSAVGAHRGARRDLRSCGHGRRSSTSWAATTPPGCARSAAATSMRCDSPPCCR